PIPQVKLSIPYFIPIPYTDNKLLIMGGLSYGWFTDDSFKRKNVSIDGTYATQVLYHRKYGFLKFQPNSVWSFITGVEMDTQWGGHFYKDGKYQSKSPAKIKDFFKVLVPMAGGSDADITDRVNVL